MCTFYNLCWKQQLSPLLMLVQHSQGDVFFKFLLVQGWCWEQPYWIRKPNWQFCSPPPNTNPPLKSSTIVNTYDGWVGEEMPSKMTLLMFPFSNSHPSSSSAGLRAHSAHCRHLPRMCCPPASRLHSPFTRAYIWTPRMWSLALGSTHCLFAPLLPG